MKRKQATPIIVKISWLKYIIGTYCVRSDIWNDYIGAGHSNGSSPSYVQILFYNLYGSVRIGLR